VVTRGARLERRARAGLHRRAGHGGTAQGEDGVVERRELFGGRSGGRGQVADDDTRPAVRGARGALEVVRRRSLGRAA
jgi:hypothetical protein